MDVYIAKPLVAEPSPFEVEIAIATLKNVYKSPGTDQIQSELIQTGSKTLNSETPKLVNSVQNREELPPQ
jgi:hypothetical protein